MSLVYRRQRTFTITSRLYFGAAILCFITFAPSRASAGGELPASDNPHIHRNDVTWLQTLVDDFRDRLSLSQQVRVSIVPENVLMMSVESDGGGTFLLSLEQGFVETLSEDDIKAAIAHELGHVWIFTHHPFLQTERLANEIAMRIVTRESLVSVYEKVWQRQGTKGDLVRFVGD